MNCAEVIDSTELAKRLNVPESRFVVCTISQSGAPRRWLDRTKAEG